MSVVPNLVILGVRVANVYLGLLCALLIVLGPTSGYNPNCPCSNCLCGTLLIHIGTWPHSDPGIAQYITLIFVMLVVPPLTIFHLIMGIKDRFKPCQIVLSLFLVGLYILCGSAEAMLGGGRSGIVVVGWVVAAVFYYISAFLSLADVIFTADLLSLFTGDFCW